MIKVNYHDEPALIDKRHLIATLFPPSNAAFTVCTTHQKSQERTKLYVHQPYDKLKVIFFFLFRNTKKTINYCCTFELVRE